MSKLLVLTASALLAVATSSRLEPEYLPPRGYARSSASASSYAGASASAYSSASASANYENVNNGDGTYRYSYDTPNGISAHESGSPRASGPEGPAVTAEGGFSYRAPDGQQISLTYTADERGFRPSGAHLPTPPPIPEAILRSIEFNKRNPSSDDSGAYRSNSNSNGYRY